MTSKSCENDLPDDAKQLKHMVLTLLGQIDDLQGQLLYLKKQMFGKKSEKLNPNQLLMFQDLYNEIQSKLEDEQPTSPKPKRSRPNANHKGRKPLPADLPRDTVELEPSEDEKICPDCHQPKQRIGEEVTEKLDYIPASIRVQRIVRPKFACKGCESHVSIAELPPMALDKGIPAEGMLAHVITSKYADHLPLNRLEGILERHGVEINVSTMCDWVGCSSDLLTPLTDRLREKILQSAKIHCDATVVPVKSKKRKGSTYNGYLWAYIGTDGDVYFDFTPTQSRAGPNAFFQDYRGYVQFAGSERGAHRAAVIYSLVASCKLCGHDPYAYFRDVLTQISTHPSNRIDELLPSHWVKPAAD